MNLIGTVHRNGIVEGAVVQVVPTAIAFVAPIALVRHGLEPPQPRSGLETNLGPEAGFEGVNVDAISVYCTDEVQEWRAMAVTTLKCNYNHSNHWAKLLLLLRATTNDCIATNCNNAKETQVEDYRPIAALVQHVLTSTHRSVQRGGMVVLQRMAHLYPHHCTANNNSITKLQQLLSDPSCSSPAFPPELKKAYLQTIVEAVNGDAKRQDR